MGLIEQVVKTWKCDHCGCHTQADPMGGEDCWGKMRLERHASDPGVCGPNEKSRASVVLLLCGTCFDRFDPLFNKEPPHA